MSHLTLVPYTYDEDDLIVGLLCEHCEIGPRDYNDDCWGHVCPDCRADQWSGDWYYLTAEGWSCDDATAWDYLRSGQSHLEVYRCASMPYSWEVGYV